MLFNNQSQVWRHRGRKFFKFNQQKNAKIPWHQKYLLKCGKLSASCLETCLNLKQEINEICIYSWYVYRLLSKFRNSCFTRSSTSIVYINSKHRLGKNSTIWKKKSTFWFSYKIWQFLKRFVGTFCWAQTLKLEGVRWDLLCPLLTSCQQSRPKKKDFKNQYFATHGFDCNDISFVPVCLDIWICVVNQRRRWIHIIISFQLPSNIQIFWPILNDGDDCTKFLLCRSQGKTALDREECLHIKLLCTYLLTWNYKPILWHLNIK